MIILIGVEVWQGYSDLKARDAAESSAKQTISVLEKLDRHLASAKQ